MYRPVASLLQHTASLEWKWRRLLVSFLVRGADHMLSEKSQWTQNGTMFVDFDWLLNASSPLSASAELLVFLSRSESGAPCVRGVYSSNTHCVAVYRSISTRFAAFFRKGLHFWKCYIVLTFVAKWRHNFPEIAVKNCENPKNRPKSVCAPLRIDSWGIWKKNSTAVV